MVVRAAAKVLQWDTVVCSEAIPNCTVGMVWRCLDSVHVWSSRLQ